jgi:hypothetical protein
MDGQVLFLARQRQLQRFSLEKMPDSNFRWSRLRPSQSARLPHSDPSGGLAALKILDAVERQYECMVTNIGETVSVHGNKYQ